MLITDNDFLSCCLCPRNCKANRLNGEKGYCGAGTGYHISSVCIHRGEEPVISGKKGICNIFFSHCNMECLYCQNYQISRRRHPEGKLYSLSEIIASITEILDTGVENVGFVSPSHMVLQVISIIEELRRRNYNPVFVWNSNAFDKKETIQALENYIDVYLPDFKYIDSETSENFSGTPGYSEVALTSIKEMYRQKGSTLINGDSEIAESGLIIRHLVLPGKSKESIRLLETIAGELSVNIHISLMSQYYPTVNVRNHRLLNRTLTEREYMSVVNAFHKLGFSRGWVQELSSYEYYSPDFRKKHPFE